MPRKPTIRVVKVDPAPSLEEGRATWHLKKHGGKVVEPRERIPVHRRVQTFHEPGLSAYSDM